MARYDPFEEMDRMFEQFRTRVWTPDGSLRADIGMPARSGEGASMDLKRHDGVFGSGATEGSSLDLRKSDGEFVFVADLPGFEREDIDLAFDDGALTLAAESETREEQADERDGEIARRGELTSSRRVSERVTIPDDVVEDEITASYRNGVLEVHLPLANPEDEGTKIDIGE